LLPGNGFVIRWIPIVLSVVLLLPAAPLAQDAQPLPDRTSFLAETVKRLRSNDLILGQYVFQKTETRVSRDSSGRAKKTDVKVYEVFPAPDPELTYLRLILQNGVRPPDLDRKDREQAAKVKKWADQRAGEGVSARAARERKLAEADRDEAALVDEVLALYKITMTGREWIAGRPAVAFTLDPRPDYEPKTDKADIIRKFKGRAWIDEEDHELARLDMEAAEPVSIGLGIIARLYTGSRATVERRKVDGQAWLPSRSHFVGSGRVLLVRRIDIDQLTEYGDYKRVTADTATSFTIPK
jgi:hypothetical protein